MYLKKITPVRHLWIFILLALFQLCAVNANAQYSKLLDFGSTLNGADPFGSVITDGTFLYGMTYDGGAHNYGTIYKVNRDGTGFAKLLDFDGTTTGMNPYGALYYDGTYLYGMAYGGGANNQGTIFKLKPDGTGFVKLLDFSGVGNGGNPRGSLISDGTFLYGTTSGGGVNTYYGTVFKINPDGTGFTKLHDFDNTTGYSPNGALTTDGTFLYGVTSYGGTNYYGGIFKIMPDGTNFSTILNFSSYFSTTPYASATLVWDGTFLYGTTQRGGASGYGTIFKVMPDGTSFTTVLSFDGTVAGATPKALSYDGTFLYGLSTELAANGAGTVYKIKTDGTGLTILLNNDLNNLQTNSDVNLLIVGTTLYGVAHGGSGYASPQYPGTVFAINTDGSGYTKLAFFETSASSPTAPFIYDGTYFYSTSSSGGLFSHGTVFKVKPDGTGYQDLYDFGATNDGSIPYGSLVSDGTFLYGITNGGGVNGVGTVFKIMPDGTGYSKLFDFDGGANGGSPYGTVFYDGTFLYGMTSGGGQNSYGIIFKISPAGAFTKLYDFDGANSGGNPKGSLISDGTFLYGTTSSGGSATHGTIFKIKPDGSTFTKLLDLDGTTYGSQPTGDLFYDGSFLYALANGGGANNSGVIFKLKTDGTGASKLLDFDGTNKGAYPQGALISDGTFLYGTTQNGGYNNWGTLFRIKPDATGYQKLLDFADGQQPMASPTLNGSFLYGATSYGGANNGGVFYKTTLTPFVSVSGFTPTTGVVGTYVTISGVDFDSTPANNVVTFNGVAATVKTSTANSLVVVVPANATTGTIAITANGSTGTTAIDFTVTTQSAMTNATVQNCNIGFTEPIDQSEFTSYVQTFVPIHSTDKIKVHFTAFSSPAALTVYDGPSTSSPVVATLSGNSIPSDITATNAAGELTFAWQWQDIGGSSTWQATITCFTVVTGPPPTITQQTLTTPLGGSANVNLVSLISTSNNNLDTTSLQITVPPVHGSASINSSGVLTVDYTGVSYAGKDSLTMKACDKTGVCATQQIYIEVVGDIIVYNGISPNGVNPKFVIQSIDVLPETKNNTVYIFDRWENLVWHGSNYDNNAVVFTGNSDGGAALPSGVYFYRIDFASGKKTKTGFISLHRQ